MLIKFTDNYINEIFAAYNMVGHIHSGLCIKEPFMGNSPALDKLYALSVIIAGIADHISHDDNSKPKENEALLLCLRKYLKMAENMCGACKNPVFNPTDFHNKKINGETVYSYYEKQNKENKEN